MKAKKATKANARKKRTAAAPKFKANVPKSIVTPASVKTRIGTLKFDDGLPDAATVKKVYDSMAAFQNKNREWHDFGYLPRNYR